MSNDHTFCVESFECFFKKLAVFFVGFGGVVTTPYRAVLRAEYGGLLVLFSKHPKRGFCVDFFEAVRDVLRKDTAVCKRCLSDHYNCWVRGEHLCVRTTGKESGDAMAGMFGEFGKSWIIEWEIGNVFKIFESTGCDVTQISLYIHDLVVAI